MITYLLEVAMCENAEAAISSCREGRKKFEDWGRGWGGGGWLKKFRTLGITDLGGGVLLLGGKYPITCQGCSITNNCNEIFS